MLENIFIGFAALFHWQMFASIAVGVVGGVFIGLLPGLTSTMGVALLIPITFSMPPSVGMAMLGGIYLASTYSGSISAILLNIPGTPAAVATLQDGYPLTRKGESTRALAIVTFASCVGGLLSVFALLFIAPPLAAFSLRFGSPEYFLLAVFGITVISSLAGDAVEKGLIAGVIGLLLSIIGMHPLTGFMRFTYDIPALYDGVPLVISLIGLYSIPEVITMISPNSERSDSEIKGMDKNPFHYVKELLSHKLNLIRSSIIGIIIGIVPGVGCSIGGFLSYGAAKKASKNPEKFGHGSIEGVIASEAANNAVTGGTLIPLLTLGIPGNPVTAILLGGIMIHGLRPGADLFTANPEIVYSFILSLFISNIMFVPVGLFVAKYCVKIVKVPSSILAPSILGLAVIGSYAIRGSLDDVLIMLFIGLCGYSLMVFSVPRAPMVLGLVLGTMAEGELMRSLALVQGDVLQFILQLFTRPISLVIVVLCVLSLWHGIRREIHGN